jgi:phosphoglycerate dehydrogenase-like enzyme
VLFCSDHAFADDGERWAEVAPGLRTVQLRGDEPVAAAELAGVEIASFSADLFPGRTMTFLRAALAAPDLRWMHLFNVGVDSPIFGRFRDRGVRLTTSAGSSAAPIAHSVVMHLVAMCRHTRTYEADQRERRWQPLDVVDVEGRVVGVVGLGSIGAEVARISAAFGMQVIGTRRRPVGDEPCETWASSRLSQLLAIVDDLVLAAPLDDDTRGMIGAAELAMMKPGAHIVNIGRGELIDEPALIDALASGHIGAAALDVFVTEPLPAESPLWDMPNVIVTPHSAGTSRLSRRRAGDMFVENLGRYVRSEPLRNEVK